MSVRVIKQIVRGCGSLPHVGSHPGTIFVLMLPLAGIVAGELFGLVIMLAIVLPPYLLGAYERAELSDERQKERPWPSES